MTLSPKILIVEDNPLDAELTRWSLAEAGYTGEPTIVSDGLEALAALRQEPPFEHASIPDLVILDLNLRLMDGPEVLEFIRSEPACAKVRVAVLSSAPEYLMRSKAPRADWHFSKSNSLDAYAEIGRKILAAYRNVA